MSILVVSKNHLLVVF